MKNKINLKLKRLFRELKGEKDFLNLLIFKEFVKKLRDEIEDFLVFLFKKGLLDFVSGNRNRFKNERKFISELQRYREPYLTIKEIDSLLTFFLNFTFDNFVDVVLKRLNCYDKVPDKEELKEDIWYLFFEDKWNRKRRCFESIICAYFEEFFEKYTISISSLRFESAYPPIDWQVDNFDKPALIFDIRKDVFDYSAYSYYEIDENYLKEGVKNIMDDLFEKKDDAWWNLIERFYKRYPYFKNFLSINESAFISAFSEFLFDDFIGRNDFYNTILYGKEDLVKITEESRKFFKEFVVLLKRFRYDMQTGNIVKIVWKNNFLKEKLIKIVSNHCKKEYE